MKIFGSTKKSKHSGAHSPAPKQGSGHNGHPKKKKSGLSGLQKALIAVLAVLATLALAVVIFVKTQIKPPDVTQTPNNPAGGVTVPGGEDPGGSEDPGKDDPGKTEDPGHDDPGKTDDPGPDDPGPVPQGPQRVDGVYTFLALGTDRISGSTDTIMIARFDTNDYSLNVVSIPRDTLVNVSWSVKKINTLYNFMGRESFLQGFADVLGFQPDFYGIINLNAFIDLINAIGGVDYYVPQDMDYDDPAQDLYIHFTEGWTHMYGQEAMEYMRFRQGYDEQDIGRIHAQQSFLSTTAKQLLDNVDSVPITTLVNIFMTDVRTSLNMGECGWFAKELLKLNFDDIHFYTMPGNYNDYAFGGSYATVKFEEWLEMVNEYLNPFDQDLTAENFDMVTRDSDGDLYATSGVLKVYG